MTFVVVELAFIPIYTYTQWMNWFIKKYFFTCAVYICLIIGCRCIFISLWHDDITFMIVFNETKEKYWIIIFVYSNQYYIKWNVICYRRHYVLLSAFINTKKFKQKILFLSAVMHVTMSLWIYQYTFNVVWEFLLFVVFIIYVHHAMFA